MKSASSYLPLTLSMGVLASILWAVLSMPPGLQQQARLLAAEAGHDVQMALVHAHHPEAYLVSWDDFFAPWRR